MLKTGDVMAKKKIGAYITLDGEKEFRTATSACNKSLSTLKSEMKLVEAQTTGSANTLDTLKKKHDVLSKTLDEQVKKEETVKNGLRHAEAQYEKVGNELEGYRKKLEQSRGVLEEMKASSDTMDESLEKQRKTVEELNKIVEKGELTYQRAGNRVQDWRKQLNNAEAQTIRATKELNENTAYMKEAERAIDRCAESIDQFGEKTDNTANKLTEFGTIAKANLRNTVVDIGKEAFTDVIRGTLELQDAQNQLQASTGAAKEATKEYSEQMREMYSSGYADSINDAANAMALVKQYTNETDPSKIKELTENGIALEDTFGMDLSESIRGADALMDHMGVTAEQAFDYIAKGAQNGLNKSGELTDNLAEYGQLWGQAGFSAEEMFAILQNGLDSGAYNLDKINDYVKEFGNSLADGRVEENINAFSADTKNLFYQWKSGEATTKQVFQSVISDLANMENQQQALTIASETWSALGEDNAMKVITSLNNVNDTYKNVRETMEEIKKVKYDSVSNQWKALGRTFQTDVMSPMLEKFLPTAQKGLKVLTDNIEGIGIVAKAATPIVAGMFVVKKGNDLVELLQNTQKNIKSVTKATTTQTAAKAAETAAEAASTKAKAANTAATTAGTVTTAAHTTTVGIATAAQSAFNTVLAASPMGVFMLGVVAVTGAVAILSDRIGETTTKTDELTEATDKNIEKLEEVSNSLKDSSQSWDESLEKLSAQQGVADNLVTELYKLEAQSGKTETEIGEMSRVAGQLNSMFPELSLSVDENTCALSANEQQTRRSIDAALQLSKASAAQEQMVKIADELVEAEMAEYEAKSNLNAIGDELKALDEERVRISRESSEAVKNGAEAYVEYNGKMMDAQSALMEIADSESALIEKRGEQENALGELSETCEEVNEQYQSAYEYTKNLTEGTGENTKEIEKNTEAKTMNAEADVAKQETSSASIEVIGEEKAAYESLSSVQQQLAVDVTNGVLTMQENVQSALESQMNMFAEFDGGVQVSTEQLLANMQSQIDGVTAWEQNLSTLADRGINQGILQKLSEMGPQGSGYVAAFNSMTDAELSKANELWSQSLDIQGMTNEWGQKLLESGAQNIAGGMQNLTPVMEQSGANTVLGLVRGMQQAQVSAEAAGQDLGVKTVDSVNEGLGVHSPSTKTMQSGKNTAQGLVNGLNQGKVTTSAAAKGLANSVITQIDTLLTENKFYNAGLNVSQGLAIGIRSGKSEVISAATEVAAAAVDAANKKLEINSPSKAFRRIGEGTMEGFVQGVQNERYSAMTAVTEALDFKGVEGKIDARIGMAGVMEQKMLQRAITEAVSKIKIVSYLNGREVTRGLSDMGVVFSAKV